VSPGGKLGERRGDEPDNCSLVSENIPKVHPEHRFFVKWGRMAHTALAHSVALRSAGISRGICQVQGSNRYSIVFATTCRIRPAQLTRKFRPLSAQFYSIFPCLTKETLHETKGKREATPLRATAKTTEKSKVSEKVTEGERSCKIAACGSTSLLGHGACFGMPPAIMLNFTSS
jgi:hypothetical protein